MANDSPSNVHEAQAEVDQARARLADTLERLTNPATVDATKR